METITINAESTPYFGGLGDSVILSWIAEGAKNTNKPIDVWASGSRRLMLELLGVPMAPTHENSLSPSGCYNNELADGGIRPRIDYCKEYLGITTPHKRPTATIPQPFLHWAKEERQKISGDKPFVVMFPQTHWAPRQWSHNNWLFLGMQLKQHDIQPIMMLTHQDDRYTKSPTMSYWGFSLAHVMAMMAVADVVIGNDSGPAHIAGTIGTKTIALLGPTKPTVFAHDPNVHCLQSKNQPCVGCHFQQPFSMACDIACSALMTISPQDVINKVKELL